MSIIPAAGSHRVAHACMVAAVTALECAAVAAVAQGDAPRDGRAPAPTALAQVDTPGDPSFTLPSSADSPTESSGPFDATRGDLGADDDLSVAARRGRRRGLPPTVALPPDPLAGSPPIDPATTGPDAETVLARMLPPRSDAPTDWHAELEPLHRCGEPRALPPCVPPPPCHPSDPPRPSDLIGVRGVPTCGPIYGGPCAPRSARAHDGHLWWLHGLHDACFDRFYAPK